jgi:hypothetical protein
VNRDAAGRVQGHRGRNREHNAEPEPACEISAPLAFMAFSGAKLMRSLVLMVLASVTIGCAAASGATSVPKAPPIVRAPDCAYLEDGPEIALGVPVHVREPARFRAPLAIDPLGRYLGISRDDGVSVFSLAWGRELHRVRGLEAWHWAWLGPGRLVYREQTGQLVEIDLDRATRSELDTERIPAHAQMRPDMGLVAWLTPSRCEDPLGCNFGLSWGPIGGTIDHIAIGDPPWRTPTLEWIGHDGNVVLAHHDTKFLVGAGGLVRLQLARSGTILHERWLAIDGEFEESNGYLGVEVYTLAEVGADGSLHDPFRLFPRPGPAGARAHGTEFSAAPVVDRAGERIAWTEGDYLHITRLVDGQLQVSTPALNGAAELLFAATGCGLLIAGHDGRLHYSAMREWDYEPRTRGLAATRVELLGGSIAGELELVVEGQPSHWSSAGLVSLAGELPRERVAVSPSEATQLAPALRQAERLSFAREQD